jgi:hypothetical protein
MHLFDVAPNSYTKALQELIWESNLIITKNVDSFSYLCQPGNMWSDLIPFKLIFLYYT